MLSARMRSVYQPHGRNVGISLIMRNVIAILLVCLPALAQSPAGQWISDTQWLDRHNWQRMVLTLNGEKLTGKYGNVDFDGTFRNGSIEATVRHGEAVTELHGRLEE